MQLLPHGLRQSSSRRTSTHGKLIVRTLLPRSCRACWAGSTRIVERGDRAASGASYCSLRPPGAPTVIGEVFRETPLG